MDGKFGSFEYTEERARGTHHFPVIRTAAVKADNGIYPLGMIAGKNADGELIPYGDVEHTVIHTGTGPGAEAAGAAVLPADAVVKIIVGGALATATYKLSVDGGVSYGATTATPADGAIELGDTGVVLTLAAGTHVANDLYSVPVRPGICGVLDEKCDTATTSAAMVIAHGSVRMDALKADIAGIAPGAALLTALAAAGIYEE